uniref:olfactory receptor 5B17-like n=1 Tax=Epinephelus lanceolatus TaxID=310571 RepID=UPI0014477AAE|nr:olfactory receptor 5B17-like [Epinephelus lanceolatus]
MENQTLGDGILLLEGLNVSPQSTIPAFIILLLIYIFAMVSNISLVSLIFLNRNLHKPVYLLYLNMSVNDIFGASAVTPHVLRHVFTPHSERYIHYIDCVVQAFCVTLYANINHTALMIMAFDRYVAICNPLRYATIMTNRMVVTLSVAAWGATFIAVAILLGLTVRLSHCKRFIPNPFCDNASLFMLSCESFLINNIYGLLYTVVIVGSSLISVALTYLRIAAVCLRSKNKVLNSKALQTCSTHLAVYVFLLVSSFVIVILHRFPQLADHRKVVAVLAYVIVPALNAAIYGLQIKAVRQRFMTLLRNNKVSLMDVK